MDVVTVKLTGFDELAKALRDIPERMAKNDLRAGVSAAARVIRDEAKRLVPVDTGTLRASLYIKQIRELSSPTKQTYYVGARQGKKYQSVGKKGKNLDAYYARFVELGHFARGGKKWVGPKAFLRPAFDTRKEAAIEAMKARLKQRLDAYAR